MTAALQTNLPPAALTLIKEGTPKPQTLNSNPTVTAPAVRPQEDVAMFKPAPEQQRPAAARTEKEREDETIAIVSATFRLPANIPPVLLKASSERKIKKIQPFTQQDIVAEALTAWLKKNGYQL
jgi:hypothetical protein